MTPALESVTMHTKRTVRRRSSSRRSTPIVLVLAALLAGSCGDGPSGPRGEWPFLLRDAHQETMTVRIEDAAVAAQAIRLVGSGEPRFVIGALRAGNGGFNQPWSWHLDPSTIQIAVITIEACQTDIRGVEDDLEYWLQFQRTSGPPCIGGVFASRD